MTIEKGKEWGTVITVPANVYRAENDAHLAQQTEGTLCMVTAGDVWNTLGEPPARHEGETATVVPIDALEIVINTSHGQIEVLASSNIRIGRLVSLPFMYPRPRFVVLTNCGVVDGANMAPRAHPNDGVFDIVTFSEKMSAKQRIFSRQRLRTGTHVPHPHISVERKTTFNTERSHKREPLLIDGVAIRDWNSISVCILPDYWRIII